GCLFTCLSAVGARHSFPTRRSSDLHGEAAAETPPPRAAKPAMKVEKTCSRGLASWLAGKNVSLAISSYQSGRIYLVGTVREGRVDRKSTRLNSSHVKSSYAVFCLKK